MRILLTNDDGISAAGLHALVAELDPLGELCVVAPGSARNAASRSFSLDRPV
ncbi:MAG: 5'/3'-nucleotidase SurE, partial [Deltaproteobacteria bacterium]|nr:5'/3'-nucleotidase SurE [Deltaproteobacteria bacterium]